MIYAAPPAGEKFCRSALRCNADNSVGITLRGRNERPCRSRQKPFQNEEELYVGLSGQKAATTDERLINSYGEREDGETSERTKNPKSAGR